MQFITLKESLTQKIYPIYLLQGIDTFSLKKGVELFKKTVITMPEVNFTRLQGSDLQAEKLQDCMTLCRSIPFLEERRLIVIENFTPTVQDFQKYCKEYFENPLESTVLVIVNTEGEQVEKGTKEGKKRRESKVNLKEQANVQFVACDRWTEGDILKLIGRICTRANVTIEREAAYLLIEYTRFDLTRIENELLKLIAFVHTQGCITAQHIQEFVQQDFEFKIFELSNAIALKRQKTYMQIQRDLRQKGMDCLGILNTLLRHFQSLVQIHLLQKSAKETATILNMKPYAVQKQQEQIAKIGAEKLTAIYQLILRAIQDIKNGKLLPESALTQTVVKIFYQ